jgi:TPR repeat protein
LIHQAADAGAPDAQFQMGIWSNFGYKSIRKDLAAAVDWFSRAGDQGMLMAQYNAAMLLHDTHPDQTYYWLSLALPRLTGDTLQNGTGALAIAAAALKPEERTKMDERVKQWRAAHPQPTQ